MILVVGLLLIAVGVTAYLKDQEIENFVEEKVTTVLQPDAFTRWDSLFKKYGGLRDVPWRWLKAICWIESDLGREASVARGLADVNDKTSISADGLSYGLMQVTLPTANRSRVRPGTSMSDLNQPEISIDVAARILKEISVYYFPGDREGIIRSYNGGPGWKGSSEEALAMTERYYSRFKSKLSAVLEAQPGDELERS